ncbi:MAG: hypothetical protein K2Y20_12710 [Sphingomonas sp.]|nr:hypothetical protein [Sphingomonas sp.]
MSARLLLPLADRFILAPDTFVGNPGIYEGNPGDDFNIANLLRSEDFARAAESADIASGLPQAEADKAGAATEIGATLPQLPLSFDFTGEVGATPDPVILTGSAVALSFAAQASVASDGVGNLAGNLAGLSASADEADVVPVGPNTAAVAPVTALQGGPLIVQIDRVGTATTPVSGASQPIVTTEVTQSVTASIPGFALEWAPLLEAHSGTATAHVTLFDTSGTIDVSLLTALHEMPSLPPITPPNGDGLGA